jgi:hypothetical protein
LAGQAVTLRGAVFAGDPAGEPLADLGNPHQVVHGRPPTLRAQKFPRATSLSAVFPAPAPLSAEPLNLERTELSMRFGTLPAAYRMPATHVSSGTLATAEIVRRGVDPPAQVGNEVLDREIGRLRVAACRTAQRPRPRPRRRVLSRRPTCQRLGPYTSSSGDEEAVCL